MPEGKPTPGRNDPCHCGSGRKYKQCHLEKDEAARRKARAKEQAEGGETAAAATSADAPKSGHASSAPSDPAAVEGPEEHEGIPETDHAAPLRRKLGAAGSVSSWGNVGAAQAMRLAPPQTPHRAPLALRARAALLIRVFIKPRPSIGRPRAHALDGGAQSPERGLDRCIHRAKRDRGARARRDLPYLKPRPSVPAKESCDRRPGCSARLTTATQHPSAASRRRGLRNSHTRFGVQPLYGWPLGARIHGLSRRSVMSLRIGDEAPNFTAETTEGKINFHEWIGDGWADPVLAPQGLHARLHHRARLHGEAEAGVREAQHQGHRPQHRSRGRPQALGQGHRGDAGHGARTTRSSATPTSRWRSCTT